MNRKSKIFALVLTFIGVFVYGQEFKTLTSEGKMRKSRSILSKVISVVPKGAEVELIYKSYEKGSYRVIYDNKTGYLNEKHFKTELPSSNSNDSFHGSIVFREDFNNNSNNWRESKNASKEFFFNNGQYGIIQRDVGRLTWESKPIQLNTSNDFVIEAAVTLNWKSGGGAHLMYGIDENGRNYHSIKLKKEKGKKEVYIGTYSSGRWEGVWTDARIEELGRQNKIQIVKKGRDLDFYINGKFIYSKPFSRFFGNGIGLGCEGLQNSSFDYLQVSQGSENFQKGKTISEPIKQVETYQGVSTVELDNNNGVYSIPLTLNNALQAYAIFESGARDITISSDLALNLFKSGTIGNNDWLNGQTHRFADGSVANSNRFKIRSLSIGNRVTYNITCSISNYMKVPMILGKNVLDKLGNHTFDYEKGTLTIN
jgi:hypothetical protein